MTSETELLDLIPIFLKEANVIPNPSKHSPVVNFKHPITLQEELQVSLESSENGVDHEELKNICKNVIKYSVLTGHRHFYNQLYGGLDHYGLAGSWLTEALNSSQYTFEVAPVFSLVENAVIQRAATLFGFALNKTDGLFSPGGSISNMYGIVLARYHKYPQIKENGMSACPNLKVIASEETHYSASKASHWLGIGTNNLILVKTDKKGRMIPECLKEVIIDAKKSSDPFIVIANAGTTVLGAFDPIEEIASICEKYKIWLHVDACYGGCLIFSDKYKSYLKGIGRADSISWNPHKMLGAPLQCSLFLVQHKNLLHQANSASATYLFQQDKFYDITYDTGNKSVQCGRKIDAFKLWLMWKARGEKGFEDLVNRSMANLEYFKSKIIRRPGFEIVMDDSKNINACFWYIPPGLRHLPRDSSWWDQVNMVAPKLKERMVISGVLMLAYNPLPHKGLKNFFRLVVPCHPLRTYEDMDYIIEQIERMGEAL